MAHSTARYTNIIFLFSYPPKKCHGSDTEGLGGSCTYNKFASQLRDPEFMEPKSFIMGTKHGPLLLSLSSNAVTKSALCFIEILSLSGNVVHSTDMLRDTVQNKGI